MRHQYLAALTAAVALMLGVQTQAAIIIIEDASGAAGSTVSVDVTLNAEGEDVAGTQNDIIFPTGARIGAKEDTSPNCTVNPAINKPQTTFAFLPNGCSGTACTGVRSLVLAFGNVNPIATGSVLYTCEFTVDAGATGTLALACAMPGASDPDGGALDTTCDEGGITIGDGPTPTATEEPIGGTRINIGSGGGEQGDTVPIEVTLDTEEEIAGTQNDIIFSGGVGAAIVIPRKEDMSPDCTVNPAINKPQTTFAFLPNGCEGELCTGVRALVLAFGNVNPIPDGSVLYTCNVQIQDDAADGEYDLTCMMPGASDPDGGAIETACNNGTVTVGPVVVPTTPPVSPTTPGSPSPTPTSSTPGVGTPTITPTRGTPGTPGTPTRTPTGGFGPTPVTLCDDSCAIVAPADAQTGWLLLLPAAMLIWLRRRSR